MIKIFVSHAWADKVKDQFGQIYEVLKNYDLWIDKNELKVGEDIRTQIKEALHNSEIILVLWSQNAALSPEVEFEIKTARDLGKIILPCIIDDYPLDNSELLKGRLYIDLCEREGNTFPALGWMKVSHFLADFYIKKITKKIENYDPENQQKALSLLENLKANQKEQKVRISFLEDSLHRKNLNALGRNRNNPYINNMLEVVINDFKADDTSVHKKQVAEFLEYTKIQFSKYPGDDVSSVKNRESHLLEKIQLIDPKAENEYLRFFKEGLLNN